MPYNKSVANIYLDEPLRCVNDVCDYIDLKNSKVVRNIKHIVPDTSVLWRYSDTFNSFHFIGGLDDNYTRISGMSNMSRYIGKYTTSEYPNALWLGVTDKNIYWVFNSYYDTTLDNRGRLNLIARLNEVPMVLDYPTVHPTEETISLTSIANIGEYTYMKFDTNLLPKNSEFTVIQKMRKL